MITQNDRLEYILELKDLIHNNEDLHNNDIYNTAIKYLYSCIREYLEYRDLSDFF